MKIRRIGVIILTLLLNLSIVACVTSLSHTEGSSNSVTEYLVVEDKKSDNKSEKTSLLSFYTFIKPLEKKPINIHEDKIYFFKFNKHLFKPPIFT